MHAYPHPRAPVHVLRSEQHPLDRVVPRRRQRSHRSTGQ